MIYLMSNVKYVIEKISMSPSLWDSIKWYLPAWTQESDKLIKSLVQPFTGGMTFTKSM